MTFTLDIFIQIIIIPSFLAITGSSFTSPSSDWREIEKLAEDHPYILAVLNAKYEYMCSGFSLDERTAVTAGSCVESPPRFVALSAVLGDDIVGKNVLVVTHTKRHSDYSYYVSHSQPSETLINSNIALVYVAKKALDYFFNVAVIGNFGPLQIRKKELEVIGYGELDSGAVVLKRQVYIQKTCVNPQWYYCICGIESSSESSHENEFGEGGPVVLEGKVIGIAAVPCGSLVMPATDEKYNVFTVIIHYYEWISGKPENANLNTLRALKNTGNNIAVCVMLYIAMLLIIGSVIPIIN